LQANGDKLREGLLSRADDRLRVWIEKNVSFPNTMVDRIVPALTPERLHDLQFRFGTDNPELVATEAFTQWVIEDKFKGIRPRLNEVGAQFVVDVKPFEEMKLRLLNASHSLIAYAGLRKNYRFVHEAIRDSEIRQRVEDLFRDVSPQLETSADLNAYTRSLIERFDNEQLPHQLKQIAMDGSQKLKQRIVPSLQRSPESRALHSVIDDWAHLCFETTPDDPQSAKIVQLREGATFEVFRERLAQLLLTAQPK
jgi:fructuronate reductase